MLQQLELFSEKPRADAGQVSHVVVENGREVLLHYRVDRVTTYGTCHWSFRPDYSDQWREVKTQRICLLLDAGEHPRNFELAEELKRELHRVIAEYDWSMSSPLLTGIPNEKASR
jgi:hypothetical protein